jgi:pyruvate dehydrogenase phosphatase
VIDEAFPETLVLRKTCWVNSVHFALCLLRDALGGNDEEKVSRMMTVDMCYRWMESKM